MNYASNVVTSVSKSQLILSIESDFLSAMLARDIHLEDPIIADGKIYRFRDKVRQDTNPNGWYRLVIDDNCAHGSFGHWSTKTGMVKENWVHREKFKGLKMKEKREILSILRNNQQKENDLRNDLATEAAIEANDIWNRALKPTDKQAKAHKYLKRKGILPLGARIMLDQRLIIPIYDREHSLISLQFIDEAGNKRFLHGSSPKGGFFLIPGEKRESICICEGYATGVSLAIATNFRVAVAFSAENLFSTALSIQFLYKSDRIICADNDVYGKRNIGLIKASEAANGTSSRLVLPRFRNNTGNPTDFNDLARLEGLREVRSYFTTTFFIPTEELRTFKNRIFKPQEELLSPWLNKGTTNMIYARAGIGKSFFALNIAYAVASGRSIEAFNWKAFCPSRVLYLDGELKGSAIQDDLKCISNGEINEETGKNFTISIADDYTGSFIDLSDELWRSSLDIIIEEDKPELIIIDNILSFVRKGKLNDVSYWNIITDWTKTHTKKGISFLFVHHENKSGSEMGTVAIKNHMSSIISLRRTDDYIGEDEGTFSEKHEPSTTFIMTFTKHRAISLKHLPSLEVTFKSNLKNFTSQCTARPYKLLIKEEIISLFNAEHTTQKGIVDSFEKKYGNDRSPSKQYVSRVLKEAKEKGLITRQLKPWEN